MNENVKIDYDTAEKVMDLDGCGLRHTAAPATPDPAQVQGLRQDHRRQDARRRRPAGPRGLVDAARRRSMKIMMIPGFSWAKSVGPKLPKLPDGSCPAWCPATHFGYQTQA